MGGLWGVKSLKPKDLELVKESRFLDLQIPKDLPMGGLH